MTKRPPVKEKAVKHHLREIADCLDEALRLQSRVMDLTEQVYEAAGMRSGDRTLRAKVPGPTRSSCPGRGRGRSTRRA